MQHPRLQHRHRRRKTNYRPNRKQRTHSKLLWRTIPGQRGDWRIQGMDRTDKKTVKMALKNPTTPPRNQEEMISDKEMQNAIKKLKRKKSLGPDKLPNEIFIEAEAETRKVLKTMIEKAHKSENIPDEWAEGEIIRIYKGKGQKGKCSNERGITLASNVGKVYERIINERVKQQVQIMKAQAGGKSGCATVDHLIVLKQTIQEIQEKGHTAYIIFLDVQKAHDKAWLDAIIYTLHKNGVHDKNLRMIKKHKLQSNCQDTNQVWTNQENQHQGQHKTRGSTISNRVCNPHGWNGQRTPAKKPRNRNTTELHLGLAAMDGWCMPDPPRPTKTTRNTRRNKPCRKQIPYPIWSCQM